MTADVTVIIPIFGDTAQWRGKAFETGASRALFSAEAQTLPPTKVVVSQAEKLSDARNKPAMEATTEWLIFLDADDELDVRYIEAMMAGDGDVRQPSTLGVTEGKEDPFPVLIPKRPLMDANYIVIGAMVRRDLFVEVGGFQEFEMYEDWDLWIRCWLAGGRLGACPEAIYRVSVRHDSRNNGERVDQVRVYNEIRNQYIGLTPRIAR